MLCQGLHDLDTNENGVIDLDELVVAFKDMMDRTGQEIPGTEAAAVGEDAEAGAEDAEAAGEDAEAAGEDAETAAEDAAAPSESDEDHIMLDEWIAKFGDSDESIAAFHEYDTDGDDKISSAEFIEFFESEKGKVMFEKAAQAAALGSGVSYSWNAAIDSSLSPNFAIQSTNMM